MKICKLRDFRTQDKVVSRILVDPQPGGAVAVYLAEAGGEEAARLLRDFFEELKPRVNVAQLSRGKLVSYAVQTDDPSVLYEIEGVLRKTCKFMVVQHSFDYLIYQIIKDLCAYTESRLLAIPHCDICGRPEPFPGTIITLTDKDGRVMMSCSYCGTCTANLSASTNKDFVLSLLSADRRDFSRLAHSELIRLGGRRRYLRYKVRQ